MKSLLALIALVFTLPAFAADPHAGMNVANKGVPEVKLTEKATVINVLRVPQYVYLEVMHDNKPLWLAASTVPVKKGDVVRFDNGMIMHDFYSNSLKRSFPRIAFVNRVVVDKAKK